MRIAYALAIMVVLVMLLSTMWLQNINLLAIIDGIKLERTQMAEIVKTAKEVLEQATLDVNEIAKLLANEPSILEDYLLEDYLIDDYSDPYPEILPPDAPANLKATTTQRECLRWGLIQFQEEEVCLRFKPL